MRGIAGLSLAALVLVPAAALAAGPIQRVSLSSTGKQGFCDSYAPALSDNGRFVAFSSGAAKLVPGDGNHKVDVFVRDLRTGKTTLVSLGQGGVEGNGTSDFPALSAGGRFVAFDSEAGNLVPGDTNGAEDVFVRDRLTGTTERVSVATDGTQGNGYSFLGNVSSDGRYVTFESGASNLVPGDTNDGFDVFVRDRLNGTTERVSLGPGGIQADGSSFAPQISGDGRVVVFQSEARNLAPGDTQGLRNI
jgi:Tol biopolymer transport system component